MNLDMIFFLLTLACFVMLIWGMIKPTKTFLGPESTRSKVVKVYGFGFIALFMAFIAAIPKPTSVAIDTAELTAPTVASIQPAVAPAASPAPPEKTLGFSAEDFRKNFNGIVAAIDSDFKLAEFDIEPGTVNNTFKRTMGKNIGIFGTVGKQSGNLKELMIIVGGTDSNEAMDVLKPVVVILAAAQAANPNIPKEQIGNTIPSMVNTAMENIKTGKSVEKTLGGVDYLASASEITGLMFSISPKK
jgi:hypothetical protein